MSDSKSYVSEALRTLAPSVDASLRAGERTTIDLLHGAMGAATEAGELVDALKKHRSDNFQDKIFDLIESRLIIG